MTTTMNNNQHNDANKLPQLKNNGKIPLPIVKPSKSKQSKKQDLSFVHDTMADSETTYSEKTKNDIQQIDSQIEIEKDSDEYNNLGESTFDDGIETLIHDEEIDGTEEVDEGETTERIFDNSWIEEEDKFQGFKLDALIDRAIAMGASDIHLSADKVPKLRIMGDIVPLNDMNVLNSQVLNRVGQSIISYVAKEDFVINKEMDTSYVVKTGLNKGRRLRLSLGKENRNTFMVFRIISNIIPSLDDIGITGELRDWVKLPQGLVMMNGPTGSGKSTTLASLVRDIQLNRPKKIITIEKPVEYMFNKNGKADLIQREVGPDTLSFSNALDSAMREDPDIIMVGEVRNKTEIDALLRAADTGHLAISTIHSTSTYGTISRILAYYKGDELLRIRTTLAQNLRGLATQVLLKTPNGQGRFAVREVLTFTPEVTNMILQDNSFNLIKEYQNDHHITMEHMLAKAVKERKCTVEEAMNHAPDPNFLKALIA